MTCDRLVVISGYSGFLHQYNWPPRYNWDIVESAVKHHKPKLKGKMLNSTSEKICCTYEEEKKKQIYISKNTEILLKKI